MAEQTSVLVPRRSLMKHKEVKCHGVYNPLSVNSPKIRSLDVVGNQGEGESKQMFQNVHNLQIRVQTFSEGQESTEFRLCGHLYLSQAVVYSSLHLFFFNTLKM